MTHDHKKNKPTHKKSHGHSHSHGSHGHSHGHSHSHKEEKIEVKLEEPKEEASSCCDSDGKCKKVVLKIEPEDIHDDHEHDHDHEHEHEHDDCCGDHHHEEEESEETKHNHGHESRSHGNHSHSHNHSNNNNHVHDDCCGDHHEEDSSESNVKTKELIPGYRPITFGISGMDCTGCGSKLERSVGGVDGLEGLTISVLLAKGEAQYDPKLWEPETLLELISKRSGFPCELLAQSGTPSIILLVNDVESCLQLKREGILSISRVKGKNRIRVTFDPTIVGARSVLESFEPFDGKLDNQFDSEGPLAAASSHVRQLFILSIIAVLLTIPVVVFAWAPLPPRPIVYGAIALPLTTAIQLFCAHRIYYGAFTSLVFNREIDLDTLVVISTTTAWIFSIVAFAFEVMHKPISESFFETSAVLVSLILIGRLVTSWVRLRAVKSVSSRSVQPTNALLVSSQDPKENFPKERPTSIDAALLHHGDIISILPETTIVTDGVVVEGMSEVDESLLTGEARPVTKGVGSLVSGGTINGAGKLTVRVTRIVSENAISTISDLVDSTSASRAKIQDLADKIAGRFVPIILILTGIVFFVWMMVGTQGRHQSGGQAFIEALKYAITVLIVSCPCAIGLAVPMVIVIASGVGAKHGLIFKSAQGIDTVRKCNYVLMDKTGTITEGNLKVIEHNTFENQETILSICAELTNSSKHPISKAVNAQVSHLLKDSSLLESELLTDVKTYPGQGIEATLKSTGEIVRGGSPAWTESSRDPNVIRILEKGHTIFCVSVGSKLSAVYSLSDSIRPEAYQVIQWLQKKGITVGILSGDHTLAVQSVAKRLDIPENMAIGGCKPTTKQEFVKKVQESGGKVFFIGDGTNDAVALAQADVGVSMSLNASAIASSAAELAILREDLNGILIAFQLSQSTFRRVLLNFIWCGVYNLVAILLAAGAFVYIRISPQYAGLAEIVSVLPVIAVGLQLKMVKFDLTKREKVEV